MLEQMPKMVEIWNTWVMQPDQDKKKGEIQTPSSARNRASLISKRDETRERGRPVIQNRRQIFPPPHHRQRQPLHASLPGYTIYR